MLRNYLKIVIRILARNKLYSFINVTGLAIGLACCSMILLYVRHELSYDRYHAAADSVYRVALRAKMQDRELAGPVSPLALAPLLKRENPQVLAATRVQAFGEEEVVVRYGDRVFHEPRWYWVDQDIFQIFSIPIIAGDQSSILSRSNTAAISQTTAEKYFGSEDPIGKEILLNNTENFEVTAVFGDQPSNTHLHFDFLASLQNTNVDNRSFLQSWSDNSYLTYLRITPEGDPVRLAQEINEVMQAKIGETLRQMGGSIEYYLQSLPDIHLHSNLFGELEPNGNVVYVYVYAVIAAFILAIAGVNFVNLTTALAGRRLKELGVRKMSGAQRRQLMQQLLGESVALSIIAAIIGLILIELLLPSFNALAGKEIDVRYTSEPSLLFWFLCVALLTGVLAGMYPAIVQSGFQPDRALKQAGVSQKGRGSLRSTLVVTQFTISTALIVGTLGISAQLDYFRSKHLGLEKENLILVSLKSQQVRQSFEALKQKWLQNPTVLGIARCSALPGFVRNVLAFKVLGATDEEAIPASGLWVDYDFLEIMGMKLSHGRAFSAEFPSDFTSACIVNQSMAKLTGGESEAVGKMLVDGGGATDGGTAKIIGVVEDFHFEPLRTKIQPLVFLMLKNRVNSRSDLSNGLIRIAEDDWRKTIEALEREWKAIDANAPFEFSFVDQRLNVLYKPELQISRIFGAFAAVSVFIACLGLFALVAFVTEQRTKEIGVRKVLGASLGNVLFHLSGHFLKLVLLANAIAWPVAYIGLNWWLEGFAYRVDMGPQVFVVAGSVATLIAFVTVAFHTMKAARANPIKALRYE